MRKTITMSWILWMIVCLSQGAAGLGGETTRVTLTVFKAAADIQQYPIEIAIPFPPRTLDDPTRIRLVSAIFAGEQCVHDLATMLGLEQSTVSHQLRLLRDRGLVRRRKDGRHAYYVLDDSHVKELFTFAGEPARHTRERTRAR